MWLIDMRYIVCSGSINLVPGVSVQQTSVGSQVRVLALCVSVCVCASGGCCNVHQCTWSETGRKQPAPPFYCFPSLLCTTPFLNPPIQMATTPAVCRIERGQHFHPPDQGPTHFYMPSRVPLPRHVRGFVQQRVCACSF